MCVIKEIIECSAISPLPIFSQPLYLHCEILHNLGMGMWHSRGPDCTQVRTIIKKHTLIKMQFNTPLFRYQYNGQHWSHTEVAHKNEASRVHTLRPLEIQVNQK